MCIRDRVKGIVSEDPSDIAYGSLKEQFNARKAELNLSDNTVFKMLDLDAKQVKPILDGEAKRISLFTMIKLAYFLNSSLDEVLMPVSYTHLDVYKRQIHIVSI